MKKFFQVFLGSMAAIWLSFGLCFFGLIMFFILAVAKSATGETVKVKDNSILLIALDCDVVDRPASRKFIEQIQSPDYKSIALNEILASVDAAADDDRIKGIFLKCDGGSAGLAQSQSIIDAIGRFKKSGKWVYAYSDNYTQGNYFIATAADSIFLNPIGGVDIHGLSATTLYFKELLEKVGVNAQVVKVGTYKSAVEPFLLDSMSAASREQQRVYLGNMWGCVKEQIAKARKVTPEKVNEWADSFIMTRQAPFFLSQKIVDKVVYGHEMEERLENLTGEDELNLVTPSQYCKAMNLINDIKGLESRIAVLYAIGDIVDDGDEGIVASKIVPEIMELAEDDDIDGLVLRVNSGGGSAYASEQIWEALEQYKKLTGNPFYVSMGDVAASGGYYISCGADKIYADPLTLTGSIGIFGIIPEMSGLLNDKLGVHTGTVATNPTGLFPSLMKPMTPMQRAAMQRYVDQGYDLFTKRCAEGRNMSQDSIKAIAEGRVWDGSMALRIGLVDKLGGLDVVVADMAKAIGKGEYEIVEYPKLKNKWWEEFMELNSQLEDAAISRELGAARPLYETMRGIMEMSTLQCRMDYVTIQ